MARKDHKFIIKTIKRTSGELREFAEMTLKLVMEADQRPIHSELEKIQSQYHIDHCWILENGNKLGVVKILNGIFYSLGLPPDLDTETIDQIIEEIEYEIQSYHVSKIESTVHQHYLSLILKRNYSIDFSRKKMELILRQAKNLCEYQDITIKPFKNGDLLEIINMYIDAYQGSIDESIGMFGESIAHSAIRSILNGNFGEFRADLSGIVIDESLSIIGGVMITITEGCPFIVIIGIKRSAQHKGIGRKLMSWCINNLNQQGFDALRLWVTVENRQAYDLYVNMGFTEMYKIFAVSKQFQF